MINGLGTIFKGITGNLDNDDAQYYDSAIETLQNNQNKIIKETKESISLHLEMIDEFNVTARKFQSNEKLLEIKIELIKNQLKNTFDFKNYVLVKDALEQILNTLHNIYDIMKDLENAIIFANLNKIHPSIITLKNINEMMSQIINHNTPKNILYQNSPQNYYNLLNINNYQSETRQVFLIKFPVILDNTYDYFQLFPIPNNNEEIIIPKSNFLISTYSEKKYTKEKCPKINLNQYLCQDEPIESNKNDNCIKEIFNLEIPKFCETTPVKIRRTIIEEINDMHYIIITNSTKIIMKCIEEEYRILRGIYLITIPKGCQIQANNQTYFNDQSKVKGKINPIPQPEEYFKIIKNPNETAIELQDLKINQEIKNKLQTLQRKIKFPIIEERSKVHASVWTIPLYVIVISVILMYIKIKRYKKKTPALKSESLHLEDMSTPTSNLEEGGVTDTLRTHPL